MKCAQHLSYVVYGHRRRVEAHIGLELGEAGRHGLAQPDFIGEPRRKRLAEEGVGLARTALVDENQVVVQGQVAETL